MHRVPTLIARVSSQLVSGLGSVVVLLLLLRVRLLRLRWLHLDLLVGLLDEGLWLHVDRCCYRIYMT